jgi:hypothetical protein
MQVHRRGLAFFVRVRDGWEGFGRRALGAGGGGEDKHEDGRESFHSVVVQAFSLLRRCRLKACTTMSNRQLNLNQRRQAFALEEAHGVDIDIYTGGVAKFAVFEAEGPTVLGADDAALFNMASGEIGAGVGAMVVEDVDFALVEEDGEAEAVDFDVFAFVFAEVG